MIRSRRSLLWLAAAIALGVGLVIAFLYRDRTTQQETTLQADPLPGGVRTPELGHVEGPRFTGANVLVITIDTLRRDHLAPYGAAFETPAASRLAREGTVFEHAVSQVPLTLPSHTSLLTGLYPPHHGVRDNGGFHVSEETTTLAERFKAAGYSTGAFVAAYVLHSRWGIAQGHDTYDDSFDYADVESRPLVDVERPANQVVDAALAWLRSGRRSGRPFYLWVHLFDPHWPYAPPAEYKARAPSPYAGEVMYADAQAARLLAALDEMGLRERTLVVYASDHGESLGEHGEPTHGIFLYGASIDVPLLIAPPTGPATTPPVPMTGRRVRRLARLVDVTPTVLDLVGLPIPSDLDGVSLLPAIAGEDASSGAPPADERTALVGPVAYAETYYPRFHYNWSELRVVQTARWKFVSAPRPELYDLAADPSEQHDVSAEHPAVAATLARHLESMNLEDAEAPAPAALDPEERARLQALGYVSGSESPAARRTGPRPDPKDGLPLLQELLQAQRERDEGQLKAALERLDALARKDRDNPAVFVTLSTVYDRMKQGEQAVRAAQRAVALDPGSADAVLTLAFAFRGSGRLADAATGFERVLALDPGNIKALLNLGETQLALGNRERAFEVYQRAVEVAPRLARAWISLGAVALQLNRLTVAEQALEQAVAHGGRQPDLHFNLGVLAEQRGQRARALREYRAEVEAFPTSLGAWVNLGLLEREAGRMDAALSAFERAAGADGEAFEGPYLMAETLLQLGRRQEAERWAREASRRNPDDPRVEELLRRVTAAAKRGN